MHFEVVGGGTYPGTTGTASVVKRETTTSAVTADPNPANTSTGTILSATVIGGAQGVPVEFRNGATVLCTGTVGADGKASCPWVPSTTNTVNVTAHFPGNSTTNVSSSPSATQVAVNDTTAPVVPSGVVVSPQPAVDGDQVTVSGSAEAGSEVSVMVGGVEVCSATATVAGTFECVFTASESQDGLPVSVTATDAAGNTSQPGSGGTLEVDEAPVPTDPSVEITPNPPVEGQETEIEVVGDEGDEVVVTIGDEEICRVTIGADGTATCTWTPGAPGETEVVIEVGDSEPIVDTVDVAPADETGTVPGGSLGSLLGGSLGGDNGGGGSLGSLGSLGSSGS